MTESANQVPTSQNATFDPPSGYPCDVSVRVRHPAGGEDQRAEFPAAQLEAWAAEGMQTDEELQARMLETMRTEIIAEVELEEVMDANEEANARVSAQAGAPQDEGSTMTATASDGTTQR
jgi:hypothetical protein